MERNPNPEFGFRSCYGVLRLTNDQEPDRFDDACRYAMEFGSASCRGHKAAHGFMLHEGSACPASKPSILP